MIPVSSVPPLPLLLFILFYFFFSRRFSHFYGPVLVHLYLGIDS